MEENNECGSRQLYKFKYECCGCSACYAVCPVNAIEMLTDNEGFQYPHIHVGLCVNCGCCEIVCPIKLKEKDTNPIHIFAAKNTNDAIREKSSSGGIFSLLADYIEFDGGVIYGAAFDKDFSVQHMKAETAEEWVKFCGSKYVQSNMNDSFSQVGEDLKQGKKVLFSGTPCQIDGLKQYIKQKRIPSDLLLTCDLVCHGVPSPLIWQEYLTYVKSKDRRKIGSISFRDKERLGWHNSTLTICDKNKQTIVSETQKDNYFFQLFLCHDILRPACHKCKYSNFHRPADITIGDFWGIDKYYKQFDDDKGVSLVMINTKAGENVWQVIQSNITFFEVSSEQCKQPNLEKPSEENPYRNIFWHWYQKYGFKRTGQSRGYIPMKVYERILIFLYRCIEKGTRLLGFWSVSCDIDNKVDKN